MVYIFNAIRNILLVDIKKSKQNVTVAYETYHSPCVYQPTLTRNEINGIVIKEGAFYHKLYIAYFNDVISIRKLSKESGLGVQTIFQGLKHIKTVLKKHYE